MERICKHCQKSFNIENESKGFMANHSRWCHENPKRKQYSEDLVSRAKSTAYTKDVNEKRNASISELHKNGNYSHIDRGASMRGKKHSEESKKKMSIGSLASNHRRLRKGVIEYNGILLDSSWELALAKRLDFLNIVWERPLPIKWTDEDNIEHNYFPDFYLPEYDIYLDPKNPQAFKVQRNKIKILDITYNNIKWITSLKECENFDINDLIVKG